MLSETTGDIWSWVGSHRIVIPTNCLGVMGKGLALQAKERYPGLEDKYKEFCKSCEGFEIPPICFNDFPDVVLVPTKKHWREDSDISFVSKSIHNLAKLTGGPFALPRLGCGLGKLKWETVKILYQVFETVDTEWVIVNPPIKKG